MNDNNLVFLVQMGGGPTAGKDKSVINAHVSKQTHNRRRRERILQAQRNQDLARIYGSPLDKISSHDDTTPQPLNGDPSQIRQQTVADGSPQRLYTTDGPNSFNLLQGLDARAESYLRFGTEILDPAVHRVGYRGWVTSAAFREKCSDHNPFDTCASNDRDLNSCHADHFGVHTFAILAYYASGVAAIERSQSAHHDALNYTISCMEKLREYLNHLNHNINEISEELVYCLFRAEVLADNQPSALAHAKLLRSIFEHKSQRFAVQLDVLASTITQENHRALASWSKPVFDQQWVRQQFRDEWLHADELFEKSLDIEACQLDQSISDPALRPLLIATKRLFLQTQIQTQRQQCATRENFYWFASQSEWLQMCLFEYLLDQDHLYVSSAATTERDAGSAELQLSVALATLYVLRRTKSIVQIQGQPLYHGCTNICAKLDSRLSRLSRMMTQEDSVQYSEAIMFLLFVAAVAEYDRLSLDSDSDASGLWRRRFGQFVLAHGVTSWTGVTRVLSMFPYTENELPLPYTGWFEEVMEEMAPG